VLGWDACPDYVRQAVAAGWSVGAFTRESRLVGFRYQHALTPDVLGDGLLLVHPAWRRQGIGTRLVTTFDQCAPDRFRMSLVLNTDLLASREAKEDATGFWVAQGYELAASTGPTRLLVRHLDRPPHR